MSKQNLQNIGIISNSGFVDDLAYQIAIEHVFWCMCQGFKPWQVIASLGVPATVDATWPRAVGAIISKSHEIQNVEGGK